jgi:hypothetical protein
LANSSCGQLPLQHKTGYKKNLAFLSLVFLSQFLTIETLKISLHFQTFCSSLAFWQNLASKTNWLLLFVISPPHPTHLLVSFHEVIHIIFSRGVLRGHLIPM